MKRLILLWTLCVVSLSGLRPNAAVADQLECFCRIQDEADSIRCLADDLQSEFRMQFRGSSAYRRLISVSNDIESSARRVRSLARAESRACELREEVNCLNRAVWDVRSLVDEARFRASRGLDEPLAACSASVDRLIHEIARSTSRIESLLNNADLAIVPFRNHGGRDIELQPGGFRGGPTNYGGTYFRHSDRYGLDSYDNRHGSFGMDHRESVGDAIGWHGPRGNGIGIDPSGLTVQLGNASFRVR